MEGFSWASMIGGLAFFFFGLSSARQGLQLAAGERLRLLLGKLTYNRFFAVGLGALITVILQSSSATTVILVSFAETGLMTLTQAFGVILGADIGTTLVVILLSFKKITHYALFLVAIGIAMERLSKNQRIKYIGSVVLGFGMLFFGMHLMSSAAIPLRDSPVALKAFQFLADNPFWNFAFATLFTGIIQASAATIGLAMALSYSGALPFEACIPIVLGANVGTCITAGLSCFGMGTEGRRVAVSHVMVKVIGVALVFPFIDQLASFIEGIEKLFAQHAFALSLATAGKIALTHLMFNIFLAAVFLPFVKPGVWLVKKIVPSKAAEREVFGPKYLDDASLETPSLAFAQAKLEVMRIASMAHEMFAHILEVFRLNVDFDKLMEKVARADDKIDILEKHVRFYLSKVSQKNLNESQAATQMALLSIGKELEDIGDFMSRDILKLARKKRAKLARFSDEGWAELGQIHKLVMEIFDLTISMMMHPHEDIARKVSRHDQRMNELEQELRQSHLQRLHEMLPETYETSTIHLDLMSQFRLIAAKLENVTRAADELK
jgi:phosphate:Na+ symporter